MGGSAQETKKQLQLWLIVGAVAGVVFCCGGTIFGWIGAVLAFMGMQSVDKGDMADAQSKLKIAKILVLVGVGLGVVSWAFYVIWHFVLGAAAAL